MILQDVIAESAAEILTIVNVEPIKITGISDNSKDVKEGYLFVAVSGYSVDGHGYIKDAVRLGAAAIIGEQDIMNLEIPYIQVKNSRKVLGLVAKKFYVYFFTHYSKMKQKMLNKEEVFQRSLNFSI
jgi:UDP-N-acetylmuramoyl-L-alanyl-D-glutamate--2,6-diaminopimelate ligase